MYVCMYVCMNKRMNEHINEWMHEWMNECMNEWMNEWMNACMYVSNYACMHVCMHVYTYALILTCMHMYTHVQLYICLHIRCIYVNLYLFRYVWIVIDGMSILKMRWLFVSCSRASLRDRENPKCVADDRRSEFQMHPHWLVNHGKPWDEKLNDKNNHRAAPVQNWKVRMMGFSSNFLARRCSVKLTRPWRRNGSSI